MLWHDVPNRGRPVTRWSAQERELGDVGLASAWQGDNAGATAVPATAWSTAPVLPAGNEWVARAGDDQGVTGKIFGRIINRPNGTTAPNNNPRNQPLNVMGNPIPYFPASRDNADAVLTIRTKETIDGKFIEGGVSAEKRSGPSAMATTATFENPGTTPTPAGARLPRRPARSPSMPAKLYQVVYTVKDPYVLGAGTAAFRDLGSFFRYGCRSTAASRNPLAGEIHSVDHPRRRRSRATSRVTCIHPRHERGRVRAHRARRRLAADRRDGAWRTTRAGDSPTACSSSTRWAAKARNGGARYPDNVRELPKSGILDRCKRTGTCPKVDRDLRRRRSVRAEDDDRPGSAPMRSTTSRCRATCAATTCRARRTAAAAVRCDESRRRRPPERPGELPRQQLGPRHAAREPGAGDRSW